MDAVQDVALRPGTHWSLGRERHRFFDSMVSYLVAVASIGATAGAQARRTTGDWRPQESFVLNGTGRVADIGLVFFPFRVMNEIANERWPGSVSFVVEAISPEARTRWDDSEGPNLEGLLLRAAFTRYFEDVRPQLPDGLASGIWDFGRVVRNAFVHDGRVRFRRRDDPPVSWRGITYSTEDDGRQVLGQDLAAVEVILLMREMDDVGR